MLRATNGRRDIAGLVVFLLHTLLVGTVYYLLLWSNNKTGFLIGFALWISFVLQHLYFDGCWVVRTERFIWKAKDWYGPWTYLFNVLHEIGMPSTKSYHNIFFILFTLVLGTITVDRLIGFYGKL
jgi:hypothetical protein